MLSAYERYKRESGVLEVPQGFDNLRQVAFNTLYKRLREPVLVALMTLLILLPFLVAWQYGRKMTQRD